MLTKTCKFTASAKSVHSKKKLSVEAFKSFTTFEALHAMMSTATITKKRKSVDGAASATKKVKVAKSADKPAPIKSALKTDMKKKQPEVEMEEVKTKSKTKNKPVIEVHEVKTSKSASKPAKPAKKTTTEKVVVEDKDADFDDEGAGSATLTADQTASLLAGFSSESEDEGREQDGSGIPISKIPKAPTTDAIQSRIASTTKAPTSSDPERTPGIIYIGRIPYGFHEPQMKAYFSQFGTITHLKLARNRKTGASKHFAFLEFASSSVADIVAKTMDKYLLFGHVLQVRRVAAEQVRDPGALWAGEGRRGRNVRPNNKLEGGALRRGKTREEWGKRVGREERRREAKGEVLRGLGYEFEMPKVKGVKSVPVRGSVGEDVEAGQTEQVEAEEGGALEVATGEIDEAVVAKSAASNKKKRPAEGKPKVKEAKKVAKKVKA